MLRFPDIAAAFALTSLLLAGAPALADGDAANGETLFKRCAACHAVGAGAKHKIGPELNDLFGRKAGGVEGYKYSAGMTGSGIVWSAETLDTYLANPRGMVKGTRMSFAGLKKEGERADIIAYLRTFSAKAAAAAPAAAEQPKPDPQKASAAPPPLPRAADFAIPSHGVFHLGRKATADEVAAWDIDVRPDGVGLPDGAGTAAQGESIFAERCASCHGDFGEGRDRWPVLAGGFDTLKAERPVKTIGSYWPFLSTVFDYVRRAMPFGDARSLGNDEVYALTAYLLYLNDIVTDENFTLSRDTFGSIHLPNEANFIPDDRHDEPEYAARKAPCMTDCKPAPAKILSRARVLDVTPQGDDKKGSGSVD